jgi:hypothetical protein
VSRAARRLAPALPLVLAALLAACGEEEAEEAPTRESGFVGMVTEDVLAGDSAYRRATLRRQRESGVRLIRQTFDWSRIERRRGRYDFSTYDRWLEAVASERIAVLPILFQPPKFRAKAPTGDEGTYPPTEPRDMADFAARLAKRYGPDGEFWRERPDLPRLPIRSWQVWNEPNVPAYWAPKPDPAAYVALLRAAAEGLKSVDPDAEVVTAGMPNSRLGTPFVDYLNGMYDAGAKGVFDVLAVHPFSRDAGEAEQGLEMARRTLDDHDDGSPMWVTEIGWASGGPASPFTIGEAGQAENIRDLYAMVARRREDLGLRGVVYFNWKDLPPYPGGEDFFGIHTGLLDIRGRPKPALEAFREGARQLPSA